MVDHERVPSQAGVRIVNKFSNYIKSSAIISNLSIHRIYFCNILQYSRVHVTQLARLGFPVASRLCTEFEFRQQLRFFGPVLPNNSFS